MPQPAYRTTPAVLAILTATALPTILPTVPAVSAGAGAADGRWSAPAAAPDRTGDSRLRHGRVRNRLGEIEYNVYARADCGGSSIGADGCRWSCTCTAATGTPAR